MPKFRFQEKGFRQPPRSMTGPRREKHTPPPDPQKTRFSTPDPEIPGAQNLPWKPPNFDFSGLKNGIDLRKKPQKSQFPAFPGVPSRPQKTPKIDPKIAKKTDFLEARTALEHFSARFLIGNPSAPAPYSYPFARSQIRGSARCVFREPFLRNLNFGKFFGPYHHGTN